MGCIPCQNQVSLASRKEPSLTDPIYALISSGFPHICKPKYIQIRSGRLLDSYELYEKLGQGMDYAGVKGSVCRAKQVELDQLRAIKSVSRNSLSSTEELQLCREISALQALVPSTQDHPTVVKLYEVVFDSDSYHLVTELLTGGDLLTRVMSNEQYEERIIAGFMYQAVTAVAYCHNIGVIHRDIKLENFVLESEKETAGLKLIDFGASCRVEDRPCEVTGTDYYMAPEVVRGQVYDEKCDIWSLGVILYILLCGYPPFNGKSAKTINRRILTQTLSFPCIVHLDSEWHTVSPDAKQLIRLMLDRNPSNRPSAASILTHPWLTPSQVRPGCHDKEAEMRILRNLHSFQSGSVFRYSALQLMASQLISPSEFETLKMTFISLDTDHDGKLTQSEVAAGLQRIGITHSDAAKSVLSACNTPHTGCITFTDFVTATLTWQSLLSQNHLLTAAFQRLDTNSDGKISIQRLRNIVGLGEKENWREIEEMMVEQGLREDGMDFGAFERMILEESRED